MCGIACYISLTDSKADARTIKKMTDVIEHRGPNDQGHFLEDKIALGHRRLSILDLSPKGRQPMHRKERFYITYNGEIYNFIELRAELEALGHIFYSGTDTEVILAAYEEWGSNCCNKFNGMWAFIIYDREKKSIFVSRDRFGVKPLYYLMTNKFIALGSEIRQLLLLQESVRANRYAIIDSMLTNYDGHTKDTFFKDIYSFPAGSFSNTSIKSPLLKPEKFYSLRPDKEASSLSEKDALNTYGNLFFDAIKLRMRSDVNVGTCLSGGLDSSAIGAIASKIYTKKSTKKFIAIHAKSIDQEKDESKYASLVAEHMDLNLNIVEPTENDFLSTIDELIWTQEEPFGSASMFMGWHVFKKSKELNCPVLLNGQGGDETLLGYERYFAARLREVPLHHKLKELYRLSNNSKLSKFELLKYYIYFNYETVRIMRLKQRSLLKKDFKKNHDFKAVKESISSYRNLHDLQNIEVSTLQLPHLLRYEDRNSMRHSIETRLPFLDYRLVEFSLGLPVDAKLSKGWSKSILRYFIDSSLPNEVVWRKEKLGFEAPMRSWLNASQEIMKSEISNSEILKEITDHKNLIYSFSSLPLLEQWRYFNLACWERVFEVSW